MCSITFNYCCTITFQRRLWSFIICIVYICNSNCCSGVWRNYSLLRFGSIVNSFIKRKQYYYYTQKVGGKYIIIVVIIIVVYSCFLPEGMKNAQSLVIYMCLGLYSFYMLETMRSYFRIVNLNRTYSKLNVYNSVILLLLTVGLFDIIF